MMRIAKLVIALIIILAVSIGSAMPVFATANPDSTPTVEQIDVYRNLLETGDRLYVWYANIPYASLPDTPFSETFIWRLIDTDGTTVLGSTTGYDFNDDGYNYAVFSMYFPAADALTWEETYTLRLSGNPTVFASPPTYNYVLAVEDYTSVTTQADNQTALGNRVIEMAQELNIDWGLAVDYYLTYQPGTTLVLSEWGEAYFMYVIFGLRSMAPDIFEYDISIIDVDSRSWTSNYTDVLDDQWSGTWVQTAREGGSDLLGTGYDLSSIIILVIVCAGILFANLAINPNDPQSALLDVAFIMVVAARLGMYDLSFLALVAAIAGIYIGTKLKGVGGT